MYSRSVLATALVLAVATGAVSAQRPTFVGVPIEIHTPEKEEFELALDELELDWGEAGAVARPSAAQSVAIAGTSLLERTATTATFRATGITTAEQLATLSRSLETANPASEANFVLYARNSQRDSATRRVLTTHLAVILEDPTDPGRVLEQFATLPPEPIDGVPGGFLLEAFDPLSATQLADAIRARGGVKTAYPLVKRRQFVR